MAFESCAETMTAVKAAAKQAVGPYGFGGNVMATLADRADGAELTAPAPPAAAAEEIAPLASDYSGTNVHEIGVDEPDIVKTDGHRIVTVSGGVLYVVDAATKRVTGRVQLEHRHQQQQKTPDSLLFPASMPTDLLLAGDHALVLTQPIISIANGGGAVSDTAPYPPPAADPHQIAGPRMLLVDLAPARPQVTSSYAIDGSVLDARQVGTVARVVVRSTPRLLFPYDEELSDRERLRENRAVIERATADEWLPRYEVTDGNTTSRGRVDCAAVSRPPTYSGAEMLTVVTFDLARDSLGTGQPVTIMADGGIVYSSGEHLYVAHDQRWWTFPRGAEAAPDQEPRTEIYQLDMSTGDPPRYVASGVVSGWLINQYAMSEWEGHLRVATTTAQAWTENPEPSESAVYVLGRDRATLRQVGHVGGLGRGEQIYAVRFVGPLGYVVTFRQVDPLYTIDLRNPRRPVVAGELKITGFSSYLHPAGDGRLIGIGQEATEEGRTVGLQVSLFDVDDPAEPTRIAQHHIEYGSSEAEYDPHAFLYWPQTGLLVVPVTTWGPPVPLVDPEPPSPGGDGSEPSPLPPDEVPLPMMPTSAALALTVGTEGFTELGMVTHAGPSYGDPQIRRSLVVGDVLWTVSDVGLKANDIHTLNELAWIPLT